MTNPTDPKARVVEIARDLGIMPPATLFLADRLASEGLLAYAPLVPSERDINRIYTMAFNKGKTGKQHSSGIQAIRNHLLTLGYKEPS